MKRIVVIGMLVGLCAASAFAYQADNEMVLVREGLDVNNNPANFIEAVDLTGVWTAEASHTAGFWMNNEHVAVGDVDNDGANELVYHYRHDNGNNYFQVFDWTSGVLTLVYEAILPASMDIKGIAVGDVDNADGDNEFVFMYEGLDVNNNPANFMDVVDLTSGWNPVVVQFNNNTGWWWMEVKDISIGDLDNDGDNELLFVYFHDNQQTYFDVIDYTKSVWTKVSEIMILPASADVKSVAIGDYDNADGDNEVLVMLVETQFTPSPTTIQVRQYNNGELPEVAASPVWWLAMVDNDFKGIAIGDVDNSSYNTGHAVGYLAGGAAHSGDYQRGYSAGYNLGYTSGYRAGWNDLLAKLPPGIRNVLEKGIGWER